MERRRLGSEGAGTFDDDDAFSEESFATGRGKALHRGLTAVVGAKDRGVARNGECDLVFSPRTEVAIFIDHLGSDEGGGLTLVIHRETDMIW